MKSKSSIVSSSDILKVKLADQDNLIELFKAFVRLEQTCLENNLNYLSACQIGIPISLFVFKKQETFECFCNCKYEGIGTKIKSIEQCPSILDKNLKYRTFELERFFEVDIIGHKLNLIDNSSCGLVLVEFNLREQGRNAIIFQHEIDHCNSICIDQIGKEINLFK